MQFTKDSSHQVTDYTLVAHHTEAGLADKVKDLLAQGWFLYGTPTATSDLIAQALVKVEANGVVTKDGN